jgi:hypothetical protein
MSFNTATTNLTDGLPQHFDDGLYRWSNETAYKDAHEFGDTHLHHQGISRIVNVVVLHE